MGKPVNNAIKAATFPAVAGITAWRKSEKHFLAWQNSQWFVPA